MPLLSLAWLAWTNVQSASDASDKTVSIATITGRLDKSIQAAALIDIEAYWFGAIGGVDELGLPHELIEELSGLDIDAEYLEAGQRLDTALGDYPQAQEIREKLDGVRTLRTSGDTEVTRQAYDEVSFELHQSIDNDLATIRSLARSVPTSDNLADAITVLELSAELRESAARIALADFRIQVPARTPTGDEARQLLEARVEYRQQLSKLGEVVLNGSTLKELLVDEDPAVSQFFARVDLTIERDFGTEQADSPVGDAPDPFDIPGQADRLTGSIGAIDRHVDFVSEVSDDVELLAQGHRMAAERTRDRTLIFAFSAAVVALVAVVAASLWIVRPLRRMAFVVESMHGGDLGGRVREAGPAEVRAAARALNEAVDNINVAGQMAAALATHDLDSPALRLETTSSLGSSLRHAVSELADSISEREELRQNLSYQATHDGLTGLANRSQTMTFLDQALGRFRRSDNQLALLFIDVDGLKKLNDTHGHGVGDEALCNLSSRIESATRVGDHVGRIGGDEFIVVAEPIESFDAAMLLGNRVLQAMSEPLEIGGLSLSLSASIGIAFPTPISTAEDLLSDADLALYEAKAEGRARIKFCDVQVKARQEEVMEFEGAIDVALREDEFELHFQPLVDAHTRRLTSTEALLRWPQTDGSFVSPGVFIPIAERSDRILAVDLWVLGSVAERLREFDEIPGLEGMAVSVNVSARHLSDPSLVEAVLAPLDQAGASHGRLTVEITETTLMDDVDQAAKILHSLRDAGVRIALDDFGTGYASLTHLRRLPLDILKIDQTFVAGLDRDDDRSLVQLAINTGHLLGAKTVAEGVETEDQARVLTEMGADLLQGFGLGRPMPAADLQHWVAQQSQAAEPAELVP